MTTEQSVLFLFSFSCSSRFLRYHISKIKMPPFRWLRADGTLPRQLIKIKTNKTCLKTIKLRIRYNKFNYALKSFLWGTEPFIKFVFHIYTMARKLASLNFAGTLCKSLILLINFYRRYLCRYSLVSQREADLPVTSVPSENFHRVF